MSSFCVITGFTHFSDITIRKLSQYKDAVFRDQSRYGPSQWETSLHCKDISNWLGAYLNWSLCLTRMGNPIVEIRQSYDHHIDGLVQDCSNSIANALELLQSCTNPSISPQWDFLFWWSDIVIYEPGPRPCRTGMIEHRSEIASQYVYVFWRIPILVQL